MDLTLSTEQQALRAGVRDYLAGQWDADRLRAAVTKPGLRAARWKDLAELGVFGLIVPEEAGGTGLALADAAIVLEELGAALVPGPVVASVLAAGLVDGVLDGDAVVTMLDLATAPLVVEHPDIATHVVAVDRTGLFLQPMADVAAAAAETPLDPLTPVAVVTDEGQPRGQRVGGAAEARAWRLRGTVLSSAFQVGVARGGLDLTVRYAGERVQFGRVIGGFQAVKHLLAESLVRVELARAAVLTAAVLADDPEAGAQGAGDVTEAAATAKVLADDAATAGGRTCVQVHGGMGFTWEVLAHLYLKRAWVHETAFGPAHAHAAFLAERLAPSDPTSPPPPSCVWCLILLSYIC